MELKPWETWKRQAWGFCDKCKNAHICQAISKGAQLLWEPCPCAKYSGACWRLRAWIQLTLATPTKIPSVDPWQVPRQAQHTPGCPEEGYCTSPEPQAFPKMQLLVTALPRTVRFQCWGCFCPPQSPSPARQEPALERWSRTSALCERVHGAGKPHTGTVEQLWTATAQTMSSLSGGPGIEGRSWNSNLEEDKMKPQPSLHTAGNEGRKEEGAMLKVWSKKIGGRS